MEQSGEAQLDTITLSSRRMSHSKRNEWSPLVRWHSRRRSAIYECMKSVIIHHYCAPFVIVGRHC